MTPRCHPAPRSLCPRSVVALARCAPALTVVFHPFPPNVSTGARAGGVLGGCPATAMSRGCSCGYQGRILPKGLGIHWHGHHRSHRCVLVTVLGPFAVGALLGAASPTPPSPEVPAGCCHPTPYFPGTTLGVTPWERLRPSPEPAALSSVAVGHPGPPRSGLSRFCQRAAESHLCGGTGRHLWGFSSPSAFQNPSSNLLKGFPEAAPSSSAF